VKLLVSWLKELCPTELSPEQLADLLSEKGAGVESISRPWAGLHGVVVARVLEVTDHPGSDTLCLARVDAGGAERRVVVGVRNMNAGDLVPYAPPGASLPALQEPLGVRTIRGESSEGMLCSPLELAVSAEHTGILILPADAPVGADVKEQFGLDDTVLDVEVTPNRPDFLSVIGLAREVAAATGTPLTVGDSEVAESMEKASEMATVRVEDHERCPRYLARVIRGVTLGPSPLRVQARLTASGMRPLSNVVDATNYVMLERGQPLHPFDLGRLGGQRIVVRRAQDAERLVTLDDVERVLTREDLLIADADKGVAIAGVLGSASAEVSETTADALLESAHFERTGILRTARRLRLKTEASIRFERGADPEAVPGAAGLAARLMAEWSGGTVLAGQVVDGEEPTRRHLTVRPERAARILGYPMGHRDVREVFARLGMSTNQTDGAVDVEIPGYREDLEAEVDLIEEIARVQGYDRVGSELPGIRRPGGIPSTYAARRRVREALVRAGLRETWSYSFASAADLALMGDASGVKVANPLTTDDAYLRASLVPGLLRAVRINLFRQVEGVALFEVGHVFRLDDPVAEPEHAAFVMRGSVMGFPGEDRIFDFFDGKGAVESLLEALGVRGWGLGPPGAAPFHPGRSAVIEVGGGRPVGTVGELHPRVAGELDLPGRVVLGQIDVTALADAGVETFEYREVPRFPPARRDLAWILDAGVPAGRVQAVIEDAAAELLESCRLFDLFSGPPIPEGRKSLAFAVTFRAPERTLTDQEVDAAVAAIDQRVSTELGGELRAG
jgi:phenylalanyl-tRNA synthetase beta chain